MTNVQREDVTVTIKMRTGVGPYRGKQLVEVDPETAAGLMSANLADLMPVTPAAPAVDVLAAVESTADTMRARHKLDSEGAGDGAAGVRVPGKPRRRQAAGNAIVDGVHDNDDAPGAKPVEGTDPGRSGDPAS